MQGLLQIYLYVCTRPQEPSANSPKTQSHVLLTAREKIACWSEVLLLPWCVCCDIVWKSSCLSWGSSQRAWQHWPHLKVSRRPEELHESLHSTAYRQEHHGQVTHEQRSWHHNKRQSHLVNAISCNVIPLFTDELYLQERVIKQPANNIAFMMCSIPGKTCSCICIPWIHLVWKIKMNTGMKEGNCIS